MGAFQVDLAEDLVASGVARWIPESSCLALEREISALPWLSTHLDWSKFPNCAYLDWGAASETDTSAFIQSLPLSQHNELLLVYSPQSGLCVSAAWLANHPDLASCNAEQYFVLGGSADSPDFGCLAEFVTGRTIWAMPPNNSFKPKPLRGSA